MEVVDRSDAGPIGATHYLPHHAVIREKRWHHCCGDVNPADLPSRGVEATEPSTIGSWLRVPQHVCEPDQEPCSPELNTILEACAVELKAGDQTSLITVHSVVVEEYVGLIQSFGWRISVLLDGLCSEVYYPSDI